MPSVPLRCSSLILGVLLVSGAQASVATQQDPQASYRPRPKAILVPAPTLRLPGEVDSNSPALWSDPFGDPRLHILTSIAGAPLGWSGSALEAMDGPFETSIVPWPTGGNWLEGVVADAEDTWYGYYHNERRSASCGDEGAYLTPRIGAARSRDHGKTWDDLGVILEAPSDTDDCGSWNTFFIGGVGDFSVMLDPDEQHVYFYYSQYAGGMESQGIAVARLAWADRDEPAGKIRVFADNDWVPPVYVEESTDPLAPGRWAYPVAAPVFPAKDSWHDGDEKVDAFWGPSIHWNTSIEMYVMLLNRASDIRWTQEGIYVSYAARLDDPLAWSAPKRLLSGGKWYPQVLGLEAGFGTDKVAGDSARFFMSGVSDYLIKFVR
ncbi:MAG TPA: sialidase family protein [Vicinamibacterales bacterium]